MGMTDKIQQVLETSPSARVEGGVCVSWILVSEWVDAEGNIWLEENRTADMPEWRRMGILNYVLTAEDIE
jgi:hypothetical protein